ncbi:MAG: signal peptidase I [Bacteroidetes bacterium]|nr:signal peptidase I [Bacteroidota bacterium]
MRRGLGWGLAAVAAVAVPLGLRACAEPLRVASPSMEPTLRVGDHVLVTKRPRRALRRGDVVAFRPPASWPAEGALVVKRVVALGGDTLRLRGDSVWVDGAMLPERSDAPRRVRLPATATLDEVRRCDAVAASRQEGGAVVAVADSAARTCLAPLGVERLANVPSRRETTVVVPSGAFFALGDFRAGSQDSRRYGAVPNAAVVGWAAWVLASYNETTRRRRAGRTFLRVE